MVSDGTAIKSQNITIFSVENLEQSLSQQNQLKGINQCITDRIFYDSYEIIGINTTGNSQPVANVGEDQLGVLGQQIMLDGSASFDLDSDTLMYQWSLLSLPVGSSASIINPTNQITAFTPDVVGDYVAQLVVSDTACGSSPDSALMTISVNQQPSITSTAQTQATENHNYSYQVIATDPENHALSYTLSTAPAGMSIDSNGLITWTALAPAIYAVTVDVVDAYGASASQTFDVSVTANQAPMIQSFPISSGEKDFNYTYQLTTMDAEGDAINYMLINPPTGMTIDSTGLVSWLPDTIGTYAITVQVDDGFSGIDTQNFDLGIIELPPNPNDIAPPLSKTEYTPFPETISFLYENNPPVQVGMPINTIQDYRSAVITGKVLDEDNNPLRGIKITINNHDEYGHTYTRDNGVFFMVVNGGGTLTVNFSKGGYLPVQRDVKTPWQAFAYVDDLIIVKLDDSVTPIDLTDVSKAYQLAQGNVVTDSDGTRQATLLFPAGTTATMTMPDGSTQAIEQLDVRATEYTVGDNGPEKMPADLPTGSAYTYAVELSVDQAIDSNATRVDFSEDVIFYLDNFIGFPQGVAVPTGWYDKQQAYWIPSDNGLVIKIIAIVNNQAVIDATDDGVDNAASQALLDELGINNDELIQLAQLYAVGKTLWRTPITHFTPWDCNFPYVPPIDIQNPPEGPPKPDVPDIDDGNEDDPCTSDGTGDCAKKDDEPEEDDNDDECDGCIIDAQNRILKEKVPVIGTGITLRYRSETFEPETLFQSVIDTYTIPISKASVPASLENIKLTLFANGKIQKYAYAPIGGQRFKVLWNGLDYFGRETQRFAFRYKLEYSYPALYQPNREWRNRIFAQVENRGVNIYGDRYNLKIKTYAHGGGTLRRHTFKVLNTVSAQKYSEQKGLPIISLDGINEEQLKLGGWGIENHHVYNPIEKILYQGDGFKRKVTAFGARIGQIPSGVPSYGHGGPAIAAPFGQVTAVTVAPNGDVYFGTNYLDAGLIRKITADGTVLTIAGKPNHIDCQVSASQLALDICIHGDDIRAIYVSPVGEVYFGQRTFDGIPRIRKVTRNGMVVNIAGADQLGGFADNIPALDATIAVPNHMEIDKQGNLYFITDYRLRKIDTNGIITTVAGDGDIFNTDNEVLATQTSLDSAQGFTLGDDGSIYIADFAHFCIRHVTTDGYVHKYFDSDDCQSGFKKGFGGGFGNYPVKLQLDNDGNLISLYSTSFDESALIKKSYAFGMSEILNDNENGYSGDYGTIANAQFSYPSDFVYSQDQGLIVADRLNYRLRRVTPSNTVYTYGGNGLELTNKQGSKQANIYTNSKVNNAISLAQVNKNTNQYFIPSRDGSLIYEFNKGGVHLRTLDAITAKTYVQFNYAADGVLASITDANGLTTSITRDASGKATDFVSPYGKTTSLNYFADNRLKQVLDPNANHWDMAYTQGLLTSFSDRNSNLYQYTYDGYGRLKSDLNPIAGGWQIATTPGPLPNTTQTSMTSGAGRVSSFFKSKNYNLKTYIETAPDGTQQTRIIKPDSTSITTADGTTVTTQSGGTDRLGGNVRYTKQQITTTPAGLTRTQSNSLQETLVTSGTIAPVKTSIQTSTINGQSWLSEFDQTIGNTVLDSNGGYRTTTPEGRTNQTVLNLVRDVKQVQTTGFLPSEISYDANRRVEKISIGTGVEKRETVLTYYSTGTMNGELHTITNAIGQTASFQYDNNGRITKQIMPDLREIMYIYDANGNLKSLTPPGRPTHDFNYTGMDQESRYTPPSLTGISTPQTSYTYNKDKQITQITRPDGQVITLNYNATTGKLENKVTPTGTYLYGYDATTGKLNHSTSPAGITLDYTFDGFLPLSTTWSGNQTGSVTRSYDNLFRVTSRTVNGTDTINYGYDNDNLLTSAGAMTINREVQKGGLINGTTLGNVTTANSFSDFAELSTFNAQYSGADIYDVVYTRDKIGRISTKTETLNGITTVYDYAYDLAGRLIEEKTNNVITGTWTYDLNGNRTHVNGVLIATYDDQDRLLTYQGNTYTYTDNGELLTKTNGADVTSYDYDVLGNLLSVTQPDGTMIEYLIDPRGRRVGKKVNGVLVKGWLYKDKLNPIAELDAAGNIVSRFIYGDRGNIPSYMVKAGVTYRIISNQLGSPLKIVDIATGAIAQEMSYDVWGNVLTDSNPDFQPFGFAGGIYDVDTGLTRFGFRDYDAVSARWISKDPIGLYGGVNSFVYVSSNPVDFLDTNGLTESQVQCVCDLARNENEDLPIPFEKYNLKDLGDDTVGNYDGKTDTIEIDDRYKKNLNSSDLKDLYNTWVHEGIHRRNHKKDPHGITDLEPEEHRSGDKIYKEADRRADSLWKDKDKRKKLESCQ